MATETMENAVPGAAKNTAKDREATLDVIKIDYLDPKDTRFSETDGKLLAMVSGGKEYPRVQLHYSFPHSNDNLFISVRDPDENEIGIIRSLDDYDKKTVELLRHFLGLRYFAPKIDKINSIRDEFGYTFWDTKTTEGDCKFVVRKDGKSVNALPSGEVLIIDVDGSRFVIPDLNALPEKEMHTVELYL